MTATQTEPTFSYIVDGEVQTVTVNRAIALQRQGHKVEQPVEPCDATAYGDECTKTGAHVYHLVTYPNGTSREWVGDRFEGPVERFCGACGEPEGSDYAKPCCSDDAMIEA